VPVTFLLGLISNPTVRKFAEYGAVALFVIIAAFAAIKHFEAKGAADLLKKQDADAAVWMRGANENMGKAQNELAELRQQLNDERSANAALQTESARESARNDSHPAFDAPARDRLQRAGTKRQSAR
jgi:hypothetical protein